MSFDIALRFTLRWEGGYANDPDDPGGETYRGLTRKNNPEWAGWAALDEIPDKRHGAIYDDLEHLVAEPYREGYWVPAGCDALEPALAAACFDFAVHSGPARARKYLARSAAKGLGRSDTLEDYLLARTDFLIGLNKSKYLRGWMRRMVSLSIEAGKLLA